MDDLREAQEELAALDREREDARREQEDAGLEAWGLVGAETERWSR